MTDNDVDIPQDGSGLVTEAHGLRHAAADFRVEPLRAAHTAIDLEAYVASPVAITAHSAGQWPLEGFTADDNLGLLRQHEADHDAGRAYSFVLLDPAGERELGCAYLNPLGPYLARTATHLDGAPSGGWILTFWLVDDTTGRPSTEAVLRELVAWGADLGFRARRPAVPAGGDLDRGRRGRGRPRRARGLRAAVALPLVPRPP